MWRMHYNEVHKISNSASTLVYILARIFALNTCTYYIEGRFECKKIYTCIFLSIESLFPVYRKYNSFQFSNPFAIFQFHFIHHFLFCYCCCCYSFVVIVASI